MSKRRLDEGEESDTKRRMVEIQELFAALPEPAREQLIYELRNDPETIVALCMASSEAREYCANNENVARQLADFKRLIELQSSLIDETPFANNDYDFAKNIATNVPWNSWTPRRPIAQTFKRHLTDALASTGISSKALDQTTIREVEIDRNDGEWDLYMLLQLPNNVPPPEISLVVRNMDAEIEIKSFHGDSHQVEVYMHADFDTVTEIGDTFPTET